MPTLPTISYLSVKRVHREISTISRISESIIEEFGDPQLLPQHADYDLHGGPQKPIIQNEVASRSVLSMEEFPQAIMEHNKLSV